MHLALSQSNCREIRDEGTALLSHSSQRNHIPGRLCNFPITPSAAANHISIKCYLTLQGIELGVFLFEGRQTAAAFFEGHWAGSGVDRPHVERIQVGA